jgi:diguanylate cyclase (GGDEF)-like protein/PAS domain S-box-containing protein
MTPQPRLLATGLLHLTLALLLLPLPAQSLESVTLQLKWTHAFQFAGYYAAKEQGYYRDAGLDVNIVEAKPGSDPLQQVLEHRAEFGVGNSSLLLARKAGQPVVALAVIFQHSPLVLVARQEKATQGIHDLIGKRAMIEPQSDELLAYLKQEGIPLDSLKQIAHTYSPQDLIKGTVDVISAYVTNEPYYLERAHFPYQTYTPRAAGIDFYGDNLFTTESELKARPERVKAFRDASLRGWQYAMAHPEEISELIFKQYSTQHSLDFYRFEARQMLPLLRPELIEVGYMNPGRWRHIADTYADLGLLPRNFPLDGFLYQPDQRPDLTRLYIAIALITLISAIAAYTHRINRRLDRALTASRQAEHALRISEERHRLLADHASDVIWTMDSDGHFTYVSPSVEKLRGYSPAEVMQQSLAQALSPASLPLGKAMLERAFAAAHAGEAFPEFRGELEQPCKDGSTVWTEVSIAGMRNAAGEFVGILGVSRDISGRKQAEARITHLAQHDPLTDLPNRALFSERLEQALKQAQREQQRLAVLFIDLDCFKPINDQFGHAVGDLLLTATAQRMRACLRDSDMVARIGGDEFIVLLNDIDASASARQVAEKIRQALAQPFTIAGHQLHISASIGIAIYPEHGDNEIELAKSADSAMYEAKKGGRNNVQLFPG